MRGAATSAVVCHCRGWIYPPAQYDITLYRYSERTLRIVRMDKSSPPQWH